MLLDFIDLVVHVMHSEDRSLYAWEKLWRDSPRIELKLDADSSPVEPVETR